VEDDLGPLLVVRFADGTHLVARADLRPGGRRPKDQPADADTPAEPLAAVRFPSGLRAGLEAAGFTTTISGDELLVSTRARGHRIVARLTVEERGYRACILAGDRVVPSGSETLIPTSHRDDEVVHRRVRHRLDRLMRPPQQHRLVTGVQIVHGGLPGLGKRR
jgi:hypothetical protein